MHTDLSRRIHNNKRNQHRMPHQWIMVEHIKLFWYGFCLFPIFDFDMYLHIRKEKVYCLAKVISKRLATKAMRFL